MLELLSEENAALRAELDQYYCKVSKLQKLELEIQRLHEGHDALARSQQKRERLERALRVKLEAEVRRLEEGNKLLKEQLDATRAHVCKSEKGEMDETDPAIIPQLLQQSKELIALKEHQEIELAAQRATLSEQRTHIDILDSALTSAQSNIVRLEEECRKKQTYVDRVDHLQRALGSLQLASNKREQDERQLRSKLQRQLGSMREQQAMTTGSSTEQARLEMTGSGTTQVARAETAGGSTQLDKPEMIRSSTQLTRLETSGSNSSTLQESTIQHQGSTQQDNTVTTGGSTQQDSGVTTGGSTQQDSAMTTGGSTQQNSAMTTGGSTQQDSAMTTGGSTQQDRADTTVGNIQLTGKTALTEDTLIIEQPELLQWELRYNEQYTRSQQSIDAAASLKREAEMMQKSREKLLTGPPLEKLQHMEQLVGMQHKCTSLECHLEDSKTQLAERDAMIKVLQQQSRDKDFALAALLRSPHPTPLPSCCASAHPSTYSPSYSSTLSSPYSSTFSSPHIPSYSSTLSSPHVPPYSSTLSSPHVPSYSSTLSSPHVPAYSFAFPTSLGAHTCPSSQPDVRSLSALSPVLLPYRLPSYEKHSDSIRTHPDSTQYEYADSACTSALATGTVAMTASSLLPTSSQDSLLPADQLAHPSQYWRV